MTTPIAILHPGEMGVSIAASAKNGGHSVYWASEGRGSKTRERAERVGLQDLGTLAALCRMCQVIVSVCPPHAAEEVAEAVLAQGYTGLYLDANAISPQRAARIGERMAAAGASLVDAGIVGGPAWQPHSTWLYLSGPCATEAAALFAAGPLETVVIGDEIGKASALKMCYAAYSKGSTALLCAVVAAAEQLGVREDLNLQWAHDDPRSPDQNAGRVRRVTAKAWRFAGEMDEIAATFRSAGLPGEFHAAAATLYRRLAGFKDAAATPSLDEVLAALLQEDKAAV
jgi:3-hydroxyisobutyrate dehydrogenase-like beta-hydroxyacid dehydrogenase